MKIKSQDWSLIFSIGTIVLALLILNKEERRKKYKAMTSQERQELILEKMKAKGIEVGSDLTVLFNSNFSAFSAWHSVSSSGHLISAFLSM